MSDKSDIPRMQAAAHEENNNPCDDPYAGAVSGGEPDSTPPLQPTAPAAAIELVCFCPSDGDPCRKGCGERCRLTGKPVGKIPWTCPEPAAAKDSRVTLSAKEIEYFRVYQTNEMCRNKICDQALAAIDLIAVE